MGIVGLYHVGSSFFIEIDASVLIYISGLLPAYFPNLLQDLLPVSCDAQSTLSVFEIEMPEICVPEICLRYA